MAITTIYHGIEYRSRLEARWAAFMQNIGWDIIYEPFDGDGYIPDFLVQGERPFLVEVKPASTKAEYLAPTVKAEDGLRNHWRHDILILGASPIPRMSGMVCRAGWIGEYSPWFADDNGGGYYHESEWEELRRGYANKKYTEMPQWDWYEAEWLRCRQCAEWGVRSYEGDWRCRPCGGHDDRRDYRFASPHAIREHWADACNKVKWRGTAA